MLKEGERNTTFFQKTASSRRCSNLITLSMVGFGDNALMADLKYVVSKVFKKQFIANRGVHVKGWEVGFPYLE